ncbi:MAG: ORC1-type DNA replication protein [Candidatus Heimdallarchaeaceae archaeon]|jgi:cell division control protein 6
MSKDPSSNIDEIFDRYLDADTVVFKQREVLSPHYVPDILPHRDDKFEEMAKILAPALRGGAPSNIFIYGTTGTGKTAVTKHVLNKLEERAKSRKLAFKYSYMNCQHVDTKYRVLTQLCEDIGIDVPFTGLHFDVIYQKFKEALDELDTLHVTVLDEVDMLYHKSSESLYVLTRMNSDLKKSKISIIGITNDVNFKETLDPRIRSSLSEEEMVFSPYTAEQLNDILTQRADVAFHKNVLEFGVINLCAAVGAQQHGDARRSLDLLRVSSELAERNGDEKVTEIHVRKAQQVIERNTVVEVLTSLPIQTKAVLQAIFIGEGKSDEITTGDVYEIYSKICKLVRLDILTARRVGDLINELDMLGIVTAQVISKGRYGRSKRIHLTVPPKQVREVIESDFRLSKIFEMDEI